MQTVEAPLTQTLHEMQLRYAPDATDNDHGWAAGVFDSIGRVEDGKIVLLSSEREGFDRIVERFYMITRAPLAYQLGNGTIKAFEDRS